MNRNKTRRQFLGEASCASIGCISTLSSILNLKLANQAAAAGLGGGPSGDDCKTLVCVLLAGGNDSFNMLVPDDSRYSAYSSSRGGVGGGGMALNQASLVNLNQASGGDGQTYGLHPSCTALADMFNGTGPFSTYGRRLSLVANIGTLIQPLDKTQYNSGNFPVPKALFSHIDQINQWQTSLPQGPSELTGWGGRMADLVHSTYNTGTTSMSISLAGNNIYQIGTSTSQFSITKDGALLPTGGNSGPNTLEGRKNAAVDGLVASSYNNLIQDALAVHVKQSRDAQEAFKLVYDTIDVSLVENTDYDSTNNPGVSVADVLNGSNFGRDLYAAARTIKARSLLGLRRNTIFVQRGGWDHHGELLNTQAGMLAEVSASIAAYQKALELLGVADEVISYTASDFGRTLRSNGRGTDHAWGGNQLVWGGPIDGGKVFGTFPDLTLNSSDDLGNGGRILPTTSTDKYFEEMATWFGVSSTDMPAVLPNIGNFSTEPTIGFVL
ncbi:MAG: DUF1501 domain-containing protein [Akkermansiaceae bacterium]|jgi:uncharacterized protein (DUF1501 family)|nr:DUF1501 domain-containing protein [Akkermansiaceae bacterium]MDP4647204.1 DUF1501 domain-containing protein [Akkermansiaceae bacterium]MDP4720122.1 DUF1501 domain-containing protein [Akkermansiaceae bacterium]MDP4780919.1 DUF1501 domain-containing protein [Akkermansiaceae bacterium]MDP4845742.1 DUF1501 domain-containing protein [Akkermansiaceae bacterium]